MSQADDSAATPERPPEAAPPERPERRTFLDTVVRGSAAVLGGGAIYPVLRYLEPSAEGGSSAIARAEQIPPGGSVLVALGGEPVLVLRTPEGEVRAFAASCPHLGCVVRFAAERQSIECACHGGRFGLDGRRLAGPPPRPLERLQVEQVGGEFVIRRG